MFFIYVLYIKCFYYYKFLYILCDMFNIEIDIINLNNLT